MPIENFKSFVLNDEANMAKTAKRGKTEATYKVVGVSGCDFIVEKSTKTTTNTFVCLISQKQAFFKNKKDEITPFTANAYLGFINAAETSVKLVDEKGEECTWVTELIKGKAFGTFVEAVLKHTNKESTVYYLIKNGYVRFNSSKIETFEGFRVASDIITNFKRDVALVFKHSQDDLKTLIMSEIGEKMIRERGYHYRPDNDSRQYEVDKARSIVNSIFSTSGHSVNVLNIIENKYGQSGVNTFIEKYFETPACSIPTSWRLEGLFQIEEFKFSSFIDYIFNSGIQQGFADNLDNFVNMWTDSIKMQKDIYDKVVDKYPEYLASHHQILSYKYSILKNKIDEEKFARRVAEMKKFEYKPENEEYMIISPKTKEDMIEEARQQSNCLASYISHVISGSCYIFFLRKKSAPEKSVVTIEISKDGGLSQVRAKYNHSPSSEEKLFVNTWHRKKFADFVSIPG